MAVRSVGLGHSRAMGPRGSVGSVGSVGARLGWAGSLGRLGSRLGPVGLWLGPLGSWLEPLGLWPRRLAPSGFRPCAPRAIRRWQGPRLAAVAPLRPALQGRPQSLRNRQRPRATGVQGFAAAPGRSENRAGNPGQHPGESIFSGTPQGTASHAGEQPRSCASRSGAPGRTGGCTPPAEAGGAASSDKAQAAGTSDTTRKAHTASNAGNAIQTSAADTTGNADEAPAANKADDPDEAPASPTGNAIQTFASDGAPATAGFGAKGSEGPSDAAARPGPASRPAPTAEGPTGSVAPRGKAGSGQTPGPSARRVKTRDAWGRPLSRGRGPRIGPRGRNSAAGSVRNPLRDKGLGTDSP